VRLRESLLESIGHEGAFVALHYVGDENALYPHRLGQENLIAVSFSAAWSGLVFADGSQFWCWGSIAYWEGGCVYSLMYV
jgi:hypothetical protein